MKTSPDKYRELLKNHHFWPEISEEYESSFFVEPLEEQHVMKTGFKQELKDKLSETFKKSNITMLTVQCSSKPGITGGYIYYFFIEDEKQTLVDAIKGTWRGI